MRATNGNGQGAPTLITGGAGFVGSNLADRLLREGKRVRVLDDLSRPGVERNLAWLEERHGSRLEAHLGDVRDRDEVRRALRGAGSVFHLAAQVAVTTSLEDPLADFEANLRGTFNVLEELRALPHALPLVFTSTNKVYGDLADIELRERAQRYEPLDAQLRERGVGESRPLRFCTPYGCSKGAADQYVLDYARSYGMPGVVLRMSCIYGPRQFGTEDQGWVAHFLIRALAHDAITIYGDGRQVRDVLFVDDLVEALGLAATEAHALRGQAFNIGGGPANAISLLEVVQLIAELRDEAPEVELDEWRDGDQRWYVSRTSRFESLTGWRPRVSPAEGIGRLHGWLVGTAAAAAASVDA